MYSWRAYRPVVVDRFRIRIKMKSWIRIRIYIKEKSWIRIRIRVMRIAILVRIFYGTRTRTLPVP
jgi:hypothetical protein